MAVESMTVVQPSTSTTTKSSSDLVEASNALITGFTGHAMHALALKNELLDRNNSSSNGNGNSGDASNPLGRSTATESYTSYTNLSDGSSAYTVDPNDLKRLDDEMALFKTHFSHVKMQWIESSVKRKTLERLLDASVAEEAGLVSRDMLAEMERERDASKHGLKERKVQAESLRRDIHLVAGQLDVALNQQLAPTIDEARSLTRSIQDMELELAMLRNSVPEEERMTVDEANAYLDEQIVSLQALAEQLERNKALIQERKQALAGKQHELDRLSSERHSAEKLEAEARHATRNKDRRIEENCRQLADRTALMASVLGIKAIQPCPNGELRIVYDLSLGRAATLAIYSDAVKRRLVGAELLNSNTDISDIVSRSVESGDLRELVLEVLVRIA